MPAAAPNHSIRAAFDLLEGKIAACLKEITTDLATTAQRGDFAAAEKHLKQAQELTDLKKDLLALQGRYARLIGTDDHERTPEGKRIQRGLKTPQDAYRIPILQVLVALGGSADINVVPERVHGIVKGRLKDYDHTVLPSDGSTPRWRNTAQWARNSLREDGLLRDDSPHGTWEISEKGRIGLKEQGRTAG